MFARVELCSTVCHVPRSCFNSVIDCKLCSGGGGSSSDVSRSSSRGSWRYAHVTALDTSNVSGEFDTGQAASRRVPLAAAAEAKLVSIGTIDASVSTKRSADRAFHSPVDVADVTLPTSPVSRLSPSPRKLNPALQEYGTKTPSPIAAAVNRGVETVRRNRRPL